jgi:hypothetical protein
MDALGWLRDHVDAEGGDQLREMVRTFAAADGRRGGGVV